MSSTLSQSALPAFETGLNALSAILDKAAAYAETKKVDQTVLLQTRLIPDMFPFARQIQIATDTAKNGSARMAGVTPPAYPDDETTISALQTRISNTLAFLKTIDAAAFDASAGKRVTFPLGKANKGEMQGDAYVTHFLLPNFYFHLTAAYTILRSSGVEIGKMDFLGKIPMTRTPV